MLILCLTHSRSLAGGCGGVVAVARWRGVCLKVYGSWVGYMVEPILSEGVARWHHILHKSVGAHGQHRLYCPKGPARLSNATGIISKGVVYLLYKLLFCRLHYIEVLGDAKSCSAFGSKIYFARSNGQINKLISITHHHRLLLLPCVL